MTFTLPKNPEIVRGGTAAVEFAWRSRECCSSRSAFLSSSLTLGAEDLLAHLVEYGFEELE